MVEVAIKHEFDKDLCRTCLSHERKLISLGKYACIYKEITAEYHLQNDLCLEQLQICWECFGLLRKVSQFKERVQKANELLHLGQGYIYALTNLTTIVLNNQHTIIIDEENSLQDTKDAIINKTEESDGYEENCLQSETEVKIIKNERAKAKNRWAKQKALQNKKPKFKIVSYKNFSKDSFRREQIRVEELRKYLKSERDSEYFRNKRFKCHDCVIGFNNESSIVKHNMKMHVQKAGDYICDICNSRKDTKRRLSLHVRQHYYKYVCKLCQFTCYRKKHRYKHMKTRHKRLFQCLKCHLMFGCRREFFKHFKEWHEKFICDVCGIAFKMRYCLIDHIRKQHSPFECKQCCKRFARYNGLWLHNKTNHSPPSAGAYCVECDKRYVDIYRYRWHLANSARHKPRERLRIPCPGCDKVFTKNIYMKDHYNLVHLKYYKYRCEECDKNFIRNADLLKHKRRVHEGILPPKNKICYMCGRGFSTNKILTNHLRTHTGERPYACTQCPARFAQNTTLVGHVRALHDKVLQ